MIAIDEIQDHPRQKELYGETIVDNDFVESIKDRGMLQTPIVALSSEILPEDQIEKKYCMIAGHRRLMAKKQLNDHAMNCWIKEYNSAIEAEMDLIHSNKNRQKTPAQIAAEISAYKQILSQIAKAKQSHEITETENNDFDRFSAITEKLKIDAEKPLNSSKIIAEQTGLSKSQVEKIIKIVTPEYRDKIFRAWQEKGLNQESFVDVNAKWDIAEEQWKLGNISTDAAAKQIDALKKEIESKLTPKKSEKKTNKTKPDTKKEKEPKPVIVQLEATKLDAESETKLNTLKWDLDYHKEAPTQSILVTNKNGEMYELDLSPIWGD